MEASKLHLLGEAILELNDPTLPAEGLFDRVAARCASLIPNSSLWVACSDTRQRAITCYFGPCRQQAIDLAPDFGRNIETHPQFIALCQGTARPVDAVSDYIGLRKWKATGMFNEVVRKAGAMDQLSSSQPMGGDLSFSMVVNRDRWGFTEEERQILRFLTPHVIQAWRTRRLMERIPATRQDALADSHGDFYYKVFTDHLGNIVEASEPALIWLNRTFGHSASPAGKPLPEPIRKWMNQVLSSLHGKCQVVNAEGFHLDFNSPKGVALRLTLAPGLRYDLHALIFTNRPDKARSETLQLTGLGMSFRQAEILRWVAYGKTNEEIAGVLGISLFTVKAHLRGIFPILMVENRNAAAAVAWQAWQKATVVRREGVEEVR